MALQLRTVLLKELPQTVDEEQAWAFLKTLELSLSADRPRVVLNCASIRAFDRSSLHLLLCCLEEAMKRNGDVRLSSLSEPARAALGLSGLDHLFKIFDSDVDAIKSFQRLPLFAGSEQLASGTSFHIEGGEELPLEATEDAA